LSGKLGKNVGAAERWLSVAAALALAAFGRRRRSQRQVALLASGFLMRRGVSGRCPLYSRFGLSSS
jgi:hypothetical protein